MQENKSQAELYQSRRKIKQSIRPFKLESHHWNYLFSFIRNNKKNIGITLSFIVVQALIEIAALLFINSSIRERIYAALHENTLTPLIFITALGAFAYLITSYLAIQSERKMVLGLINDLRQRWFSLILQRPTKAVTNESKADFIAKVSYHLPLLSLGVDHSIFGFIRWTLASIILIALGLVGGIKILELVLVVIIISIILATIAYLIAYYYISQEVTSYSQIIRHIALTLSEFPATKNLHLEQSAMEELRMKVNVDTYFRVKRDIWLRYFSRIMFTVLFMGSIISFAVAFTHPDIISLFYDPAATILIAIISLYAIRLFYEAAQAGLYLPPARLGAFLSIPQDTPYPFKDRSKKKWQHISFRSNKTKLFIEGDYFKNISIDFDAGKKYLFTGPAQSGKTALAHLLGGTPDFNRNGWLVVIDKERMDTAYWANGFIDKYLFASLIKSEKTLAELILGKEKHLTTEEDIASVYALCDKYPLFLSLLSKKRFLGESASAFEGNIPSQFAVQALRCIINKISFIVIDNNWIDLHYKEIDDLLHIMEAELPASTIVVFSRATNNILKYDHLYEIKNDTIKAL